MIAIIADIIASVDPQQMVISRSGSTRTFCVRANFSTMASRSGFAPQVMAYWLMSSAMACRAASLISAGAAKSGKPCDRLTALCFCASRVISRMTDSVNCSALAESMRVLEDRAARVTEVSVIAIQYFAIAAAGFANKVFPHELRAKAALGRKFG